MKSIAFIVILTSISVFGVGQTPFFAALMRGGASMTYQDLYTKTVEALSSVPGLEWSGGTDYKYSASFTKAERLTLSELNDILPPIFQKHGLQFVGFQTGDRSSGGGVTMPGLADYYVDVEYSQYALSLNLRGERFYIGGLLSEDRKTELQPYTYRSLGETSKIITARLVGSSAALKNRVDCIPSSDDAYCVTTAQSKQEILKALAEGFYFSARKRINAGYAQGAFNVEDRDEKYNFYHVKIAYRRLIDGDEYTLYSASYKRKNFLITLKTKSSSQNMLRIQASWVDGYTPPPEEK